jgi:DNA gyrase subunit A
VLASRRGKAIRFSEQDVRAMGRSARGVNGMNLEDGDEVVSLVKVGEEGPILPMICFPYCTNRAIPYMATLMGAIGVMSVISVSICGPRLTPWNKEWNIWIWGVISVMAFGPARG